MFEIFTGNHRDLPDVLEFINMINSGGGSESKLFDTSQELFVTRSPGRLDVMGGIADYSGSLVLQMPINEAIVVAVQKRMDRNIRIYSLSRESRSDRSFEMNIRDLEDLGRPRDYDLARQFFARNRQHHWASYVAGVFYVLQREKGVRFKTGCSILISSGIPSGKGVSSSAALEVAVMNAVCSAFNIRIEPREVALLCQKVENLIVGASCGIMDQMSVNCGVEDSLISILCQPAEILGTIEIPADIEFWGVDSGVRHAVVGSDYSTVRTAAFMGYRLIEELSGAKIRTVSDGVVELDNARYDGHLCNVSPSEYTRSFSEKIPVSMLGSEFLERSFGITDPVTTVDPNRIYPIKAATEHGIYENFRVAQFSTLLSTVMSEQTLVEMGDLMYASHKSYAACGLTESGTDRIVELVRESRQMGLFGARITGGGSGGTVVILAKKGSKSAISKLADHYQAETGLKPYIFHGSSPGSATFGYLRLRTKSASIKLTEKSG